ncbi:uncharacterized protein LOC144566016 [Carex rostrata]
MPSYAKILRELLSSKRKLEKVETVALNAECSALILNKQIKLPPKLKDPGSFTIPCKIRDTNFNRCLLDLGASVCLMPKSMYDRLGLGELKQTRMSLQLADRSVQYPSRIAEAVVVQIGKFYIPVDFVVVEIEEDLHIPRLFGRDFLSTAGTIIDVTRRRISFSIGDKKVEFNIFESMQFPSNDNNIICRINVLDTKIAAQIDKVTNGGQPDENLDEIRAETEQTITAKICVGRRKKFKNSLKICVGRTSLRKILTAPV